MGAVVVVVVGWGGVGGGECMTENYLQRISLTRSGLFPNDCLLPVSACWF